jgi:hypothetical protein
MDTAEAREKIRETIMAIRKVFKNKVWQAWADAWLAGTDQTSESAMAMAQAMARLTPTTIRSDRRPSAEALLVPPACNVALIASFIEDCVQVGYKGDLPELLSFQVNQGYERRPDATSAKVKKPQRL